jgi:adenine-specific DNA-methyltransferase
LRDLFGSKVFDNPKPLELLKDIARIGSRPGDTILDSFAGSGTLGQAVIELNEETEEHRNFILVQMTESTRDEPGKNVCLEITRERVKRAIEKYGYEGGFEYMRVGQSMDGESLLAGQLPAVEPFAQYVFYLCTGDKAAVKPKEIEKNLFLIGSTGNANVYMAYADDYDTLTRLALNTTLAEAVTAQQAAKHIVYAPACFLDEDTLRAKNIEFVSIPYGLFQRDSNGA